MTPDPGLNVYTARKECAGGRTTNDNIAGTKSSGHLGCDISVGPCWCALWLSQHLGFCFRHFKKRLTRCHKRLVGKQAFPPEQNLTLANRRPLIRRCRMRDVFVMKGNLFGESGAAGNFGFGSLLAKSRHLQCRGIPLELRKRFRHNRVQSNGDYRQGKLQKELTGSRGQSNFCDGDTRA